jgi:hypothetical protein
MSKRRSEASIATGNQLQKNGDKMNCHMSTSQLLSKKWSCTALRTNESLLLWYDKDKNAHYETTTTLLVCKCMILFKFVNLVLSHQTVCFVHNMHFCLYCIKEGGIHFCLYCISKKEGSIPPQCSATLFLWEANVQKGGCFHHCIISDQQENCSYVVKTISLI